MQELLGNVDTMIRTSEQTQQQQPVQQQADGSAASRTELLQRELGRLNSRLCCTVLALERAMSKAICRGAQSGVVTTRLVSSDKVRATDVKKDFTFLMFFSFSQRHLFLQKKRLIRMSP